jgi:Ca2+-binding RTX toxin-like protein
MSYIIQGSGTELGNTVSFIDDFDGDGLSDLVVAGWNIDATPYDASADNAGAVWLIPGAALGDLDAADGAIDGIIAQASLTSASGVYSIFGDSGTLTGGTVMPLANIDGDGLTDFLITSGGAAYIITAASLAAADIADGTEDGQISLSNAAAQAGNLTILPPSGGGFEFGLSAQSADINGDGITDILLSYEVGAPVSTGHFFLASGAQLAALDALSPSSPGVIEADDFGAIGGTFEISAEDLEPFGADIGGDFDGDGLLDLLIASPDLNIPFAQAGSVYLITTAALSTADAADGTSDGHIDPAEAVFVNGSYVFHGPSENAFAGHSAITLDFNGDGASDIAIGASDLPTGGDGQIFLLPGDAASLQTLDIQDGLFNGEIYLGLVQGIAGAYVLNGLPGGRTGTQMLNVGDTDGDGKDDLLVTAPGFDFGGEVNNGAVMLIASGTLEAADGLDGTVDSSIQMLVLPAFTGNYIFIGRPGESLSAGNNAVGSTISSAGDVDGDGRNDFVFSSWETTGTAYLILAAELDALDAADGTLDGIIHLENAVLGDRTGTSGGDTMTGSNGNDTLTSLTGDDSVTALAGDDLIDVGSLGQNTVDAGPGNDTITGGLQNDSLLGGDGDDSIDGSSGADTIDGGAGNDNVLGGNGNDSIAGGADEDTLSGGYDNDTIDGGTGNDALYGLFDDDSLLGGDGEDLVHGDQGEDTLIGGSGADTLYGESPGTFYTGNDSLDGGAGADVLFGGPGDDTLDGGTEADELDGGAGDDSIDGGAGDDVIHEADDDDSDTINGGLGDDTVVWAGDGTLGDFTFSTAGGTTTVTGLGNTLVLTGVEYMEFGDILLPLSFDSVASSGNDNLLGGSGDDSIDGQENADTILGQGGSDTILGGPGLDLITGGDDDDELRGNLNGDTIYGGAGFDSLYGNFGFDSLYGGANADSIYGGNQDDQIWGEIGNDVLIGQGDDDTVDGGDGFDTLQGGPGDDVLYGGDRGDRLIGGIGDDTIHGDDGADKLYGNDGADVLFGGLGLDALYGDAGADSLHGQQDDDRLYGGAGNDTLDGGNGNDTMFGSDGVDTFVFVSGHGADVIRDFDPTNEVIDLTLAAIGAVGDWSTLVSTYTVSTIGSDFLIDFGSGNSILLEGVAFFEMSDSNFLFD